MIKDIEKRIEIIDERIKRNKKWQIVYPEWKLSLELSLNNLECLKKDLEHELFKEKCKNMIMKESYWNKR